MKKTFIVVLVFIALITSFLFTFLYKKHNYEQEEQKRLLIYNDIKNRYNKYVKVVKDTNIYKLENNNYIKEGMINKDVIIELPELTISYETEYFKIKDIDYYINYKDVIKTDNNNINDRYKKYILFNKNIITSNETTFYDENNQIVIKRNKSFDLPIIINKEEYYGVEFLNRLLYIKKDEVKATKDSDNTREKTRTNIRTLTYHTVYQKGKEKCDNIYVCHPIEQFEEHMKYISEKGYFTLTMEELEMFLNNQIRIPKNSIVITMDDGRKLHNSIPIIEKYKIDATMFIITGVNSVTSYLGKVTYAHFESHSDNLHHNYKCSGGYYGSELLCTSYEKLVEDFKTCQKKLGGVSHYFAYPFFDSNETIIKALKDTGYKLAFVGEVNTGGYSDSKTDKYRLRRKTIFGNDSLKILKSYLPETE